MRAPETQSAKFFPLEGVQVIDFSRLLPGPWATHAMGELGTDVIKVGQPGISDPSRNNQLRYKKNSVYFNAVNGNKRSIALDLNNESGREMMRWTLRNADVVDEANPPMVPGFCAGHFSGFLFAVIGAQAALAYLAKTVERSEIDLPMFEAF